MKKKKLKLKLFIITPVQTIIDTLFLLNSNVFLRIQFQVKMYFQWLILQR